MLDVTNLPVVIVGGGTVAVRKARGLVAAGAQCVRCVAPAFHADMPAEVERVCQAFEPHHLEGARLVFAATDSPSVNESVVREAHARGLLVCRADADDQEPGDFSTPALWRDGAVTLTVSTSGNPALAAAIRDDLAARVEPLHLQMAAAMQTLRPLLLSAAGFNPAQRQAAFRWLASAEAMRTLADGGIQAIQRRLAEHHEALRHLLPPKGGDDPGK